MADNILVQSGRRLSQTVDTTADYGKAFSEGSKIIDDQIRQNRKDQQQREDREWQLKRREKQDALFQAGMESKLTQYNADKAAVFAEIDAAIERGDLSGPDYDLYKQNREKFWKDSANQIKTQQDLVRVREKVKKVGAAEQNWPNILEFSKGVTISDSSPEAQQMDYAIDAWAKNNGASPPPVVERGGKYYFEIPTADGQDVVRIPLDQASKAKSPQDYLGQYNEPVAFQDLQARFDRQFEDIAIRIEGGNGTKADLDKMGVWFDKQIQNPEQLTELVDSLVQEIGDNADLEALGLKDKTGDGLSKDDLDLDGSGVAGDSPKEKEILKQLFGVIMGEGKDQLWDKNNEGEFTEAQVNTYNAFAGIKASGGKLDSLVSLPQVFDVQINAEKGQGVIFLGDKRDEKSAFIVAVDANGNITPDGYKKLATKLGLVNVKPQKGDNITDKDPVVKTPETTATTSVLGAGQEVQGGPTLEGTTNQIQSENTPTIAISNSNFGNEPIPGLPKRFDYNKVINALVGTEINAQNLPAIKEKVRGTVGNRDQLNAIMKHIEGLVRNQG